MAELATLERILNEIRELTQWLECLDNNEIDRVKKSIALKIEYLQKAVDAK